MNSLELRETLLRYWFAPQAPRLPWRWLGQCFAILVSWRRWLYARGVLSSWHPGCPVVVVGSILVGGTGKTPLVQYLASLATGLGWQPGIVSRGYGGQLSTPRLLKVDDDPRDVGDEPLLLRQQSGCPVAVGRQRIVAARLLCQVGCNLIIADDGLQHYALRRDVEVVVLDQRGVGNGACLPVGPLREPVSRLQRVDVVVKNGGQGDDAMDLLGEILHRVDGNPETIALEALRGQWVHGVAGIGDPPRFFRCLEAAGLRVIPHGFADHHMFSPADLCFEDGLAVLMTAKDAVKCRVFAQPQYWYLPVRAQLSPALEGYFRSLLQNLKPSGEC